MFKKTGTNKYVVTSREKERWFKLSSKDIIKIRNSKKAKSKFSIDVKNKICDDYFFVCLTSTRVIEKHKLPDIKNKVLFYDRPPYDDETITISELSRTDGFFLNRYKKIDNYIKNFVENRTVYDKDNIFFKKAFLFYGPPGNGKTSYFRYLMSSDVIAGDKIFIYCNDLPSNRFISSLKEYDCVKIFIFEEVITEATSPERLTQFLKFLDGETTPNNSIIFATTNHPEQLPENITARPSRFNDLIEFDNPDDAEREEIFKIYLKSKSVDLDFIKHTKGFSLDQIKETVLYSSLNNVTIKDAINKVKTHKNVVDQSFEKYKKIGI